MNKSNNGLLKKTIQLCKIYEIKPARSKGQNFLIKEEVYKKIVETAGLEKEDTVLEVGPGLGFLTIELARIAKKVVAVELDNRLAEILRTGLITQNIANVGVLNQDVLQFDPSLLPASYKVVANLPYNITSIFLRKFLSGENKPTVMVLMLQKEVAQRIIAHPPKMSLLAVSAQFYSQAEIIEFVPANCFWPSPEVDSAIIKLKINPPTGELDLKIKEKDFFRLVKIGFSSKRKMLKNNLASGYHIATEEAERRVIKAGFNPKIRAQELSVLDWKKLLGEFS